MIDLLRSRGLTISDTDFATRAISNFSYYDLINKSKNSFLTCPGTDNYFPGITFDHIYALHSIDSSLENIVLKYILYAEGALKSNLSYIVSKKYGVYTDLSDPYNSSSDDYLYRGHYSRRNPKRNNTLSDLKSIMTKPKSYQHQSQSLVYYLHHHNHVPAWILTTSLTLGNMILWYDILTHEDKCYVCNAILQNNGSLDDEEKLNYFKTVYSLLREYRNLIAHGNKTITATSIVCLANPQVVILSQGLMTAEEYSKNSISRSGLHAVLVALFTLINDPYMRAALCKDLDYALAAYEGMTINGKSIPELFGLPSDILDRFNSTIK